MRQALLASALPILLLSVAATAEEEPRYSEKAVFGQYRLAHAARYCAETTGVFSDSDVEEITDLVKRISDASGLDADTLKRLWKETEDELAFARAASFDANFSARHKYCSRMNSLRLMLLPRAQSENPFVK